MHFVYGRGEFLYVIEEIQKIKVLIIHLTNNLNQMKINNYFNSH